jgi:hypothetical protein
MTYLGAAALTMALAWQRIAQRLDLRQQAKDAELC